MWEKVIRGSNVYYIWILALLTVAGIGFLTYLRQWQIGLGITGMSRDVSWGLYVGQLTFLVGVAASAVMVVLPYYLHNYKVFGKITILGEFVAVPAVIMCILSVTVDLGRPDRVFNVLLHPTPNSILFWDVVVLNVYLFLNIIIGWTVISYERRGGVKPPLWCKVLIYISIPWAFSIHTVTAFLYAGLAARGFWLTAIMAPRFLGSAFAAGPALLIILCYVLKKFDGFDAGDEAIKALSKIVAYAMVASLFFFGCELFTVYYSQVPEHMYHFKYMFVGLHGHSSMVPFMWLSAILAITATVLLVIPKTRNNKKVLPWACGMAFLALWLEKGLALIVVGFIPSMLETVTEYLPTFPESLITLGIWAIGALILTLLYKVAMSVKREVAS
jgi:Ni/Fe-hydrogenase subunit HybB-like protein